MGSGNVAEKEDVVERGTVRRLPSGEDRVRRPGHGPVSFTASVTGLDNISLSQTTSPVLALDILLSTPQGRYFATQG